MSRATDVMAEASDPVWWLDAPADSFPGPDIHPDVLAAARAHPKWIPWRPVERNVALAASSLLSLLECDHESRQRIETATADHGQVRLRWSLGEKWVTVEFLFGGYDFVWARIVAQGVGKSWPNPHATDIYNALDAANLLPCDVGA